MTLEEAIEIADDFEDLIDTDFTVSKALTYYIDGVLVCPYPEADKKLFISNYQFSRDKDGALSFYKGEDYDVILMAYDIDDESSHIQLDIRSFAGQMGITYSFP